MNNKTMRVVEVTEPGGAEVLEIGTRQIPDPKDHEVLIKVAAAGLESRRCDAAKWKLSTTAWGI